MAPEDKLLTPTVLATPNEDGRVHVIALKRGDALGRYIVLSRLGAGGMGVVYLAYDPELDRKLAVKVLRPNAALDEARLLREARAMARVQHPNVIAVHDVGTFSEGVFVAMELVDGTTLSKWLDEEARPWRAIVDVFVQAGRGLAAAHAVGLVHRDFKPDNVLLGSDGRARVVDFGLARSTGTAVPPPAETPATSETTPQPLAEVTQTGALVGTPSFMSPEQLHGMAVDARSDQFSFSVALYRALFGERPFAGDNMAALAAEIAAGRLRPPSKSSRVPPWVQRVVLRGLEARPENRWPSMDAMLTALFADPARRRRRWIGGGGVVFFLLVALVLGLVGRKENACGGAERRLAGVWDDAARGRVHEAFGKSGHRDPEGQFARVAGALDAWARSFTGAHADACEATRVRHEQSEELLDLRMECLGQRLDETRAVVELLSRADAKLADRSVSLVSSMTSPGVCGDLAALRAPVRPPANPVTRALVDRVHKDVSRGRVLIYASKYDEADALLHAALTSARSTGYRPAEAEALQMLGWGQVERGKYKEAESTLFDAVEAARAGRHAVIEVGAWTTLVRAADLQGNYEEARRCGRYGLAAFESIGARDQRPLARLLYHIGSAAANHGKYEEALDYDRRALAIGEGPNGGSDLERASELEAVGRVLGDLGRFAEAEQPIRRALAIHEREHGRDSSFYASSLFNLAFDLSGQGRYEESLAAYRATVDIWGHVLGPEHPRMVLALTNTGDVLRILHRYDEALAFDRRALAVAEKTSGPEHPDAGVALTNIGDVLRLQHQYDESMASYRRALAIFQKLDPNHRYFVPTLTGMGQLELDRKQPARALAPLQQALAIAEKYPDDALPLADARFALAQAEWATGGDHARAHARAAASRTAYAAARDQKEQLAAADEWLAKH